MPIDDLASVWLLGLAFAGAALTFYFLWDLRRHRDKRQGPRRRGQRRTDNVGPPGDERRTGRDRRLRRRREMND